MKRLVFLVEGDTEIIFINNHVIPYLYRLGFNIPMNAQKITTNRKLNIKGGNVNYEYLANEINRVKAQGNVIITTFLDFFRLPTSFPGYSKDSKKIDSIEIAIHKEFDNDPNLVPYIQLHEMEALMFSNMEGFVIVVDEQKELHHLQKIIDEYTNPEDINSRPEFAPSKRLESIFGYDKVFDGELILEAIGIETMILKCPRFSNWLNKIVQKLSE